MNDSFIASDAMNESFMTSARDPAADPRARQSGRPRQATGARISAARAAKVFRSILRFEFSGNSATCR